MIPASPRVIGRAREQVLLRLALAEAVAGHGRLVLIGGQAGIGKTALAAALCRESSAQGALVLTGRCYDLTETPPYGPWSEALAALPATGHPGARALDLTQFAPTTGITNQESLFVRVAATLEAASRKQPLVLLLDDLQWADPAGIHLLRFIARKLAGLPILVLATYRDDELSSGHPLYQLLPLMVRETPILRVDPRSLGVSDILALVADRYQLDERSAERLARYLHAHAEGNPFFTLEVLHTLEADAHLRQTEQGWTVDALDRFRVPPLLRQVIEGRLARLDTETRRLLEVAAVIGQQAPLSVWATSAAVDEDTLLLAVEQAVAERLVTVLPDDTAIHFAHALVREALYAGLSMSARRRLHRDVGEALAVQRDTADPDAVAYHFQRAEDSRAADWLIRAGERAQRAYAWLSATARFEAALPLLDVDDAHSRGWLLFRLAMLCRLGDTRRGVAYLEVAERLGETLDDPALTALARFNRGLLRSMIGDVYHGVPELEAGVRALAALVPADRARLQALDRLGDALDGGNGQGELALWFAEVGRFPEARALAERLIALASSVPGAGISPDSLGDAYYALAWAYAAQGEPDEAHHAFVQARGAFQAIGHRFMFASSLWYELLLVMLPYHADQVGERGRLAAEGELASEQLRDATSLPPRLHAVDLLVLEGHWVEARGLLLKVRTLETSLSFAARLLGPLARERGERDLAWAQVYAVCAQGPDTPTGAIVSYAVGLQRLAAQLALDEGDLVTARQWLEAHDRWLQWSGSLLGQADLLLGWAAYHRAAGDPEQAREAAATALALAAAPRQPLSLLAAHRLLGELETVPTLWAGAETHLEAALGLADTCAAPYERALTLLALAELRQARGDLPAARALLGQVRAICEPLGARPALARAEALSARLDSMPARRSAAPAGLTPREVEVLRLLAKGLSNAAIAARLVVSPRTVDAHLVSIYGKLAVSSRGAAVAFAIDHGLR